MVANFTRFIMPTYDVAIQVSIITSQYCVIVATLLTHVVFRKQTIHIFSQRENFENIELPVSSYKISHVAL